MWRNLPKILNKKAIMTIYKRILTKVPNFIRDILNIYVKAPLYRDYSIYSLA